ncbi:AI-2E family transporter [Corynebacterium pseudodiphtheriticum]|uniref:AI-2E family transporter n=1 Tax=Corynebacterium pseudodiphtheriticum TaxID=37637 RepID=UPI00254C17A3|nr:AI-2E family transporter [Corynebacterium pseudodiphtheriticum]MDK8500554.1 AI-2E family transporter [Corynebacterium pseudodiphtheriticum]MDK8552141.1 AI-2E family transporter [Corynebacterium pseudodiphtheriticum]MDK8563665.1 AI-2E family transporter [Corynebacterium pseudodiphtheriticum]MDK8576855.1 AI-2E family transporter [Corynebacterium pseudodiphtheriticum]MDK8583842.1 AI-2E family transporter [Corynebacterium pseudodiphtheriticum]
MTNHDDTSASASSEGQPAEMASRPASPANQITANDGAAPEPGLSNITPDRKTPVIVEDVDRSVIWARDGKTMAAWAWRMIISIAALALALVIVYFAWRAILPAILAVLVTSLLAPVAKLLKAAKFPPAIAALTTLLGSIGAVVGIFAAMGPTIRSQGSALVNEAENGARELLSMTDRLPFEVDVSKVSEFSDSIVKFLRNQSGTIASGLVSGVSVAGTLVITIVIMFVLTFFFLKDGSKFLPWLRQYTGHDIGWHATELLTRVWNTLAGFLRTQAVVSFVDAIFIGLGLWILNVPLAFVLATITFFAGFIPIIGAITAGTLAVIIALVSNGLTNALLVLGLIILVQQLESNILQPVLQSRSMGLHAAIVLLSITLGSALAGIIGAFLAVPIAATVAVIMRYHSEMVGLRAGDLTIDDIEIASSEDDEDAKSSLSAFEKVKQSLTEMAARARKTGQATH